MLSLNAVVATIKPEWASDKSWLPHSWGVPLAVVDNSINNVGVVASYQQGIADTGKVQLLAFIHDDVLIAETEQVELTAQELEPGVRLRLNGPTWLKRILAAFQDPTVGVVGFGGALGHGLPGLYKRPYKLQQLGRSQYLSNVNDAEIHGERFTGERDVAVLDGFALIVRRELLEKAGGWPAQHLTFHCYDYWLCCMAHRLGYRVRLVGVRCHHYGGQTSTQQTYQEWCKARSTTDQEIHEKAHRWIYEEFRDVLPWREA